MIDWTENHMIDCNNNNEERQGLLSISPSERIMTSRMSAARKRRAARLLKDRKQLNIGRSNRSKLVENQVSSISYVWPQMEKRKLSTQIHPLLACPIIPTALGSTTSDLGIYSASQIFTLSILTWRDWRSPLPYLITVN